jgi:hypothetical protein
MPTVTTNIGTKETDLQAKGLVESGGNALTMGAVADGEFLKRVGATVVGAASPGGGLTEFTEAETSAAPNATDHVNSLTVSASTTNADVALVAKGTGATLAQIPENTSAGGNKRGLYATDFQKHRDAATKIASGVYSVICGGSNNTASTDFCTVGGGNGCTSSGVYATVGGGNNNLASGAWATVGGGDANAAGLGCIVAGGIANAASSQYSVVAGGRSNTASGEYSAIVGGASNTVSGINAHIGGGTSNSISGNQSTVGGGSGNTANGHYATVGGGESNDAYYDHNTIGGGYNHYTGAAYASICGGLSNSIYGIAGFVGGGSGNSASDYSTIGGGRVNTAGGISADHATVGGGSGNSATSSYATIAGGYQNVANQHCVVAGGAANYAYFNYNAIVGGYSNTLSYPAEYSIICGGTGNYITKGRAAICGGSGNQIQGPGGFIGAGALNLIQGDKDWAVIGGGEFNTCSASHSVIIGGSGSLTRVLGESAFACGQFGSDQGSAQYSDFVSYVETTNNTPTNLLINALESIAMPSNTTWTFQILVTAREPSTGDSAGYQFLGVCNNSGIIGSVTKTVIAESQSAWDAGVTLSAGSLIITATGENSKTIRWVAKTSVVQTYGAGA